MASRAMTLRGSPKGLPWLHGGDLAAQQLKAEGVEVLFVLSGGHISPIFDGAHYQGQRLVDFRHEQAAAHAADAYARLARKPAVAAVTAGPGFTCALTGLTNAFYGQSPLVLLAGRNPLATDGLGNLQDAPQVEMARPVTKFAQTIPAPDRIASVLSQAFIAARAARPGPVFVELPIEVLLARVHPGEYAVLPSAASRAGAADADCRRVAEWLAKSRAPVMLLGSGAYMSGCEEVVTELATVAHLPVFCNGMGRGLLAPDHPMACHSGRNKALATADLVLCVGIDFDFRLNFGQGISPSSRVVHVEADAPRLARNRPVSLGICADPLQFLRALLVEKGRFARADAREASAALLSFQRSRWESPETDEPIDPRDMVRVVSDFLDDDAIVIGDGGDIVALFAAYHRPQRPGAWMDPGPFGCLGIGPPFAMAARLAYPQRQVVVVSGDGSFGFNAMELDSAVRQRLPFVVVIGNDGAWGEMRTFHEHLFGAHDLETQYLSRHTRYDRLSRALGGHGERVTRLSQLQPALRRAFRAGVPAVVEVMLDPSFRRSADTISGRQVAAAFGGGDPLAFHRGRSAPNPSGSRRGN